MARILRQAGLFIGTDLNESEDALPLGAYSDRWINAYLPHRNGELPGPLRREMRADLRAVLSDHCAPLEREPRAWGWKEPRSIYLVPFLDAALQSFRFVHVVRDGRDMALSANQNQLRKHGDAAGIPRDRLDVVRSISLWSWINAQTIGYAEQHLRGRYLRIGFEDLCARPEELIRRMFDFIGLADDPARASRHVAPPPSLGRWESEDPDLIARLEQAAGPTLEALGYQLSASR